MSEPNLDALNDWVRKLPVEAFLVIRFYSAQKDRWTVRFCTAANGGIAHPLRTKSGQILEDVCAELLPLAKAVWEQQKTSQIAQHKIWEKAQRYNYRRETREIEAMHNTVEDF
jgi:hypothetical protein